MVTLTMTNKCVYLKHETVMDHLQMYNTAVMLISITRTDKILFKIASLIHLNKSWRRDRMKFKFSTKGVCQLSERRSLIRLRFPAVSHQSANVFRHEFGFVHSVTILQSIDERIVKLEARIRDFWEWKHFPQDDAEWPHIRLTWKDPIGQRFNGHPLDGQQTL